MSIVALITGTLLLVWLIDVRGKLTLFNDVIVMLYGWLFI